MINTLIVKSNDNLSKNISEKYDIKSPDFLISGYIKPVKYRMPEEVKNVIITSKNAIRYIDLSKITIEANFLVVGNRVYTELLKLGYKNIKKFVNIKALMSKIDSSMEYIYFRGKSITTDISKFFHNVKDSIVYELNFNNVLDIDIAENIKALKYERIFLFSHLTTINFLELCKNHDLLEYLQKIEFYIMSPKTRLILEAMQIKYTLIQYE